MGWIFSSEWDIMSSVVKKTEGGATMDDKHNEPRWEDRFSEEKQQIANMDEFDFMALLMESRIIQQAS